MPILGYHSIDDDWDSPLAVTTTAFAAQMDLVRERVIPLDQYLERFLARELDGSEIAITFDDGYVDNLENALPITSSADLPVTLFIPSALLGRSVDLWTGTPRAIMSEDQLLESLEMGATIGAHSATHPDLRSLSDEALAIEVNSPKDDLERLVGAKVTFFCCPGGFYDRRVIAAVQRAGYRGAVVTPRKAWGRADRYRLWRVGIYRHDDVSSFTMKLGRIGTMGRWVKQAISGWRS